MTASVSLETGTPELLCTLEDRVATVTLNRPERRNALSDTLTPALREILLSLEADPRVRVVVLTGSGSAFCSGGDVSGMGGAWSGEGDEPRPTIEEKIRVLQQRQETLTLRLYELAKPTIAALPGPAAGAGLCIALACDLRIAADSAFVTTGFANIGLPGDYGGSWLLTRLVGTARARELYYTAERVPADRCLELGIFNRVVAPEALAESAREWAGRIASGPPVALRYMKENLNRATVADFRNCLALEGDRTVRAAQTEDHREAVRAFLDKRDPRFSGR